MIRILVVSICTGVFLVATNSIASQHIAAHDTAIWLVDFNQDGTKMVTADDDGVVKIWNTEKLTPAPIAELIHESDFKIYDAQFLPGTPLLATTQLAGHVTIWNWLTQEIVHSITEHRLYVPRILVDPSNHRLFTMGSDDRIKIWNYLNEFEFLGEFYNDSAVDGIANTATDAQIWTVSMQGFNEWDLQSGQVVNQIHDSFAFVSMDSVSIDDEQLLAAGTMTYLDSQVMLFDAKGHLINSFQGLSGTVWHVSLDQSATMVAGSAFDAGVKVWDTNSNEVLYEHGSSSTIGMKFNPRRPVIYFGDRQGNLYFQSL